MHSVRADTRKLLIAGGEVGRDLLAVDWSATLLGAPESWPRSLSTIVRVMLTSRFSMWMAWGAELTFFCNDAYRRDTLGKKYPWALGRPASEVWSEIWPEIGPRIETVLRTGEATWDEALLLFLERSGYVEETYHTFSYSPLPDDSGAIAGMLCVVSEDTERVIAERRMATLRDLGTVPASIRDEGEFLTAAAAHLRANPLCLPFSALYLYDEGSGDARLGAATGLQPGHPAAPAVIAADAADPVWPVGPLAPDEMVEIEGLERRFANLPAGGWSEPPQTALVVPLPDQRGGRPYGFLVVGVNRFRPLDDDYRSFLALIAQRLASGIASARTYEAERRRAEQLAELDRAKTAFFSNVSHEFRTPLTLMLAPLEDALSGPDGMQPSEVELVHRNGLRMLKLVNALLDFSRIEAGRMRAEYRPVDLAQLTRDLAITFKDATTRAGLELTVDCEQSDEAVYVDPDLWERIVLNLLSNAFKVTLEGSITVALRARPGAVELSVKDTGPGIPQEEIERLFQRFHRVKSVAARSHEGTGIGLALVRELVELHGGEVTVESVVGRGSRFAVSIPTGREHLPPDQVSDERAERSSEIAGLYVEEALSWVSPADPVEAPLDLPEAAGDAPVPSRSRLDVSAGRVLVADDNPDLRGYLKGLLSPHWQVELVPDGARALQSIREDPPDLLVTDVMMPGLDGFELVAHVRADPLTRELPVIMLSARAGEEASIQGLEAGADDYLPKPFSGRELIARVRSHLELSLVRREASEQVRAERRRLEQTLQQMPAGVVLADAESGRLVLVNAQVPMILGHDVPLDSSVDQHGASRQFTLDREPIPAARSPLQRALREGEVIVDEDVLYDTGGGRMATLRISAAPIRDDADRIVAGVSVFQDVTERVRNERLLASQRDILALIAAGAPLAEILLEIVRCAEALSEYGGCASIMLVSSDRARLGASVAPSLPAEYNAAIDGIEIGPLAGSCGAAAHRGETVIVTDTHTDPLWADFRELAKRHGLRACWSTPIRASDGRVVASFAVYHEQPHTPAAQDRRTVELLARTAAVAIERDRDARERARQLSELQSSLLPRGLPHMPGVAPAAVFHSGDRTLDVGGDFYDLFPLPGGAWGFVVGDVCGHGAEAAAVTALARHTTRAIARLEPDPDRVLAFVSESLLHSGHERFCTAVYGRLQPSAAGVRARIVVGGHPPPLIRRAGGRVERLDRHGPLLGVFPEPEFPEIDVELRPGDTVVLYTDGLIERNPRVTDVDGLVRLLGGLEGERPDELLAALERAALGEQPFRPRDDVAILLLSATGDAER